jgi:predicted molibdopterin-dependent oxidoreductase YjgC
MAERWSFHSSKRLYEDGQFATPDRRARLVCADWQPFPEQPNRNYPLILNTGRTLEHWHTRTKTREVPILERLLRGRGSK